MAKRARNYKITNVNTKNMGSTGGQIRVLYIDKIDNQSTQRGYVHAIKLSVIFDTEQGSPGAGIIAYATTSSSWNDDYVITAAAVGEGGGTMWLNLRRGIWTGTTESLAGSPGGPINVYLEITDPGVSSENLRFVSEVYGRNIEVAEI